jgi:hypothetical protein
MRERGPVFFFVCLFLVFGMRECGQMVFWPFLFFLFLANAFFPLVCEIFSLFKSKIICFFFLNFLVLGKFCDQTV